MRLMRNAELPLWIEREIRIRPKFHSLKSLRLCFVRDAYQVKMAALFRLIMDAFVDLRLAPVDVALPCFDYRMYSIRLPTTRTLSRSKCL